MQKLLTLTLLIGIGLSLMSCKDEDPIPPIPEELITTLIYTLTPDGGGADVVFKFTDLDGDGGNPPVIENGILDSSKIYTASLTLLNEAETPAEDITEEIEELDEEHQFFFKIANADLAIAYSDTDPNGNPIGLKTTVDAGVASNGTMTITLRHEPDKFADGVDQGDITNAGGETDIEVVFDVEIQ